MHGTILIVTFCSNGSGSARRRKGLALPQSPDEQTYDSGSLGKKYSRVRHCEPRFMGRSAGTLCVTATAPGSDRTGAPLDVQRKLVNDVYMSTTMNVRGGSKTQTQHVRRAARIPS